MTQKDKTKEEFIEEVKLLQKRIAELEKLNSECRQAEKLLQESQEWPKIIQDAVLAGVIVVDCQTREIVEINEIAAQMFGKPKDQIIGVVCHKYICSAEVYDCPVLDLGKTVDYSEKVLLTADGGRKQILKRVVPVEVRGRKYLVESFIDLTEQKKLEEILRKNEQDKSELIARLNDAQQIGMIGSWEWDLQTDCVWWSDETYRIFGVKPQDYVPSFEANGKFIHPDDFVLYDKAFKHSFQTGKPLDVDLRIVVNDGVLKYCHAQGKVIYDDSGRQIRFSGTLLDITKSKKVEQSLQESEERYRGIIDNIGIGVALLNPAMEILSLNSQMKKWNPHINLKDKHICYYSFNNPPRNEICSYCPTVKTLQDGLVHEAITETPMSGKIFNYRIISSPIRDEAGKIIAAIEMVEDITERKRGEAELKKHLQELEVFYKAAIGREERIIELKKEVAGLKGKLRE